MAISNENRISLKALSDFKANFKFADVSDLSEIKNKFAPTTQQSTRLQQSNDESYVKLFKLGPIIQDLIEAQKATEDELLHLRQFVAEQLGESGNTTELPPLVYAINDLGEKVVVFDANGSLPSTVRTIQPSGGELIISGDINVTGTIKSNLVFPDNSGGIVFDGDASNTFIKADSQPTESLQISAHKDVYVQSKVGGVYLQPLGTGTGVYVGETKIMDTSGNWVGPSSGLVGAAGANGANGSNGSAGADAPRLSTVRVYIGASSQPSAPSATITWSTLAVSSLTSGWSLTAPTIDASSTTTYYFSDISFVDATASATNTTSTGTTPTRSINFDGIVSFTNLNTRLADANTVIDGDRITTGTIDADLVTVDNIVAGNIKPTIAGSGQSNFAGEVTSLLYPFAYHGNFSRNASFTGSSFPSTGHNSQALRAGDIFYNTNDNRTYRYNGSSWVKFSIEADSILANNIYAGTLDCSQLTVTNLDAGSISAGTISVTRLPGLSDLAYDLSAGVAYVGDSSNTTGSVTASFSSLPAGSKIVINASLGITGPGGSQDTGQGSYYATSTGNFSVSAWNLSSTNYYVSGSSNSPPKWIYHSGVATVSSTGSCSFTFTIYSTYSRRTNINTMRITALAIEA